jgi:hypothetical protein
MQQVVESAKKYMSIMLPLLLDLHSPNAEPAPHPGGTYLSGYIRIRVQVRQFPKQSGSMLIRIWIQERAKRKNADPDPKHHLKHAVPYFGDRVRTSYIYILNCVCLSSWL